MVEEGTRYGTVRASVCGTLSEPLPFPSTESLSQNGRCHSGLSVYNPATTHACVEIPDAPVSILGSKENMCLPIPGHIPGQVENSTVH